MLTVFMPWFLFHWKFKDSDDEPITNVVSFIESPKVENLAARRSRSTALLLCPFFQ
jgi:hypothetical protein